MAPHDQIVVDYAALASAEAALTTSQQQIAAALQALNDDLTPLLATWEGDGKDAYLIQQTKWNTESDNLNLTLAKVHAAVGQANNGYQLTDRRIASAWNGV